MPVNHRREEKERKETAHMINFSSPSIYIFPFLPRRNRGHPLLFQFLLAGPRVKNQAHSCLENSYSIWKGMKVTNKNSVWKIWKGNEIMKTRQNKKEIFLRN